MSSRIRSVHPGLFTDEAFMELSPHARLMFIGLWCEADDRGVFAWKPLTIKARILPVDNIDAPALLAEMVTVDVIRQFEVDGRQYGVIRNFGRFQRPKSPKVIHPLQQDLEKYAAHDGRGVTGGTLDYARDVTASERQKAKRERDRDKASDCHASAVTHSPNVGNVTPDGGWRMEEGKKEHMLPDGSADGDSVVIQGAFPELSKLPAGPGGSQYPEAFEQFWQAFPKHKNDTKGRAYRSWRAAQRKPGVTTGVLMAGAKRHAASMTDRPIDKRPYVQTWANGNGWEDQGDNAVDSGGDEPMDQWMARYRAENRTDL